MHGSPPKRREKKARRLAAGRPSPRFEPPRHSWGTHSLCQEPSETGVLSPSTLVRNARLSVQNYTNLPDTLQSELPDLRRGREGPHLATDQGSALAAARAKGRRLGGPKGALGKSKLDGREEEIRILLQKKVSKASIAKRLRVSRIAMYHFIDSRTLDPNASQPQSRAHRP